MRTAQSSIWPSSRNLAFELYEVLDAEGLTQRERFAEHNRETSATFPSHLSQLATLVPLTLGIPLSPMLGSITRSLADVFTRLEGLAFTSEAKLDGQRVQIHVRVVGERRGGG